ncbi:MAG: hypothetical protein KJ587_12050 [Alphaproteobacteria bacterium]|nr:hypothetical protein [Alphaproteobacteria bacterium]
MKATKFAGLCVAVAIASGQALAFEEQQGAASKPASPAPGIVIDNSKPAAPAGEMDFSTPAPASDSGAKVFLPGLGTLGVLPKLDFGLELLYGAAETPDKTPQANDLVPGEEDLMIRGRVKHRF